MKAQYEAPKLKVVGSVESLTAGGQLGDFTDFDFPDNTPRGDLTFS